LILCIIIGVALANHAQWESFKTKYGKTYSPDQEQYRYGVFLHNLKRAAALQKKEKEHGATFGVTKFSDLTEAEFRSTHLMPKDFGATYNPTADFLTTQPGNKLGIKPNPTNFNWFAQAGVCTPVYNQGQCGSCWAFSATETIESYWALAGHPLTSLSVEQIVDCDTTCYGCGGGWPYLAYEYVEPVGQDSNASYPYTAEGGVSGACKFSANSVVAQVATYAQVSGETGLYQTLSTSGPVSVCVDASSWSAYTGGILTSCTTNVDHCVQAVGYANYGTAQNYWIVRNSWGTDWGVNGFIFIEIGQDLCDIGDYATVVTA